MARQAKEPQWKLPGCACVVTATRYIKMCTKHETEHQEIHDRWTADHIRLTKEEDERLAAIKEKKPV